jgi:hypothetical protein
MKIKYGIIYIVHLRSRRTHMSYTLWSRIHPEGQENEVYLGNIVALPETPSDWPPARRANPQSIDALTRRLGDVAYDRRGEILTGWRPVFAQLSQMQELGLMPKV